MATLTYGSVEFELVREGDVDPLRRQIQDAVGGTQDRWVTLDIDGGEVDLLVTAGVPIWIDRRDTGVSSFAF